MGLCLAKEKVLVTVLEYVKRVSLALVVVREKENVKVRAFVKEKEFAMEQLGPRIHSALVPYYVTELCNAQMALVNAMAKVIVQKIAKTVSAEGKVTAMELDNVQGQAPVLVQPPV